MNQLPAGTGGPPVRASDAERDRAAETLRAGYAEGRLTRAELDDRITAAYTATTRTDLDTLTGDLPGAMPALQVPGRPATADAPAPAPCAGTGLELDRCLLLCLLIAFPPAGIAYWILAARRQPSPAARNASLLADTEAWR
jgi:hypothetical protein